MAHDTTSTSCHEDMHCASSVGGVTVSVGDGTVPDQQVVWQTSVCGRWHCAGSTGVCGGQHSASSTGSVTDRCLFRWHSGHTCTWLLLYSTCTSSARASFLPGLHQQSVSLFHLTLFPPQLISVPCFCYSHCVHPCMCVCVSPYYTLCKLFW